MHIGLAACSFNGNFTIFWFLMQLLLAVAMVKLVLYISMYFMFNLLVILTVAMV